MFISNMESEDIRKKLSLKFPEHKFELCKPPSFLLNIIYLKGDIILCYNSPSKRNKTLQEDSVGSQSFLTDASSYVGNPLELPSCMEQSFSDVTISQIIKPVIKNECNYSPLTSHQALIVKGFYNLKLISPTPVVILCEGEVKLIHNGLCRNVNRVVHCSYLMGSWKTSCWSDYYKIESSSLESLSQLLEIHNKKVVNISGKKTPCDAHFKSRSVLTCIDDVNNVAEKCCSVAVQFVWSSHSIKPPVDNSEISLLIDINLNKAPTVSLSRIWKQLELLQKYMDYLESNSKGVSKISSLPSAHSLREELGLSNCELNEDNADMEMLKILCEDMHSKSSNTSKESATLMKLTDFITDPSNPTSDLTNSLWTKLIGCESYEVLQMCFKNFFEHVRSSNKFKLIKKTNITRLAHMIQADKMVLDNYVQLINPVEYLLEIGIEKLRQVLLAIFDCMKISPTYLNIPILPKYPEVTKSDDWIRVSKCWLTWLSQLYSSLNILTCAEMALGNPQLRTFYPVVRYVVSQLCSSNNDSTVKVESLANIMEKPNQSIVVKITMDLLNNSSVDTEFFDEWSLTLTSANKSRKVTSIFYRSPSCPIPYISDDTISDGSGINNATQINTTFGNTTLCTNITACLDNVINTFHCIETHMVGDYFPF